MNCYIAPDLCNLSILTVHSVDLFETSMSMQCYAIIGTSFMYYLALLYYSSWINIHDGMIRGGVGETRPLSQRGSYWWQSNRNVLRALALSLDLRVSQQLGEMQDSVQMWKQCIGQLCNFWMPMCAVLFFSLHFIYYFLAVYSVQLWGLP